MNDYDSPRARRVMSYTCATSANSEISSSSYANQSSASMWKYIQSQQQQIAHVQRQIDKILDLMSAASPSQLSLPEDGVRQSWSSSYREQRKSVRTSTTSLALEYGSAPPSTYMTEESEDDDEDDVLFSSEVEELIRKYSDSCIKCFYSFSIRARNKSRQMESDYSELQEHSKECKKFLTFCRLIQLGKKIDRLFQVHGVSGGEDTLVSKCPTCSAELGGAKLEKFVVHMDLVESEDKPKFHGFGMSIVEAKAEACSAAMQWLEMMEPEILSLRSKRLRVRLEGLGVTVPKSDHMLLLQIGRETGLEGLPTDLIDIISSEGEGTEAKSKAFLDSIPSKESNEIYDIFCKLGLSFCDELNLNMNPILFAALVTLTLRLDIESLSSDEKLKLAFCKLIETVLVFNCEDFIGFKSVVGRLLRFFLHHRALPFMSKNRLEILAIQLSPGAPRNVKVENPLDFVEFNESSLRRIVALNTPSKEYLESLVAEFSIINQIIRELFNVDGTIYGSLVNGFPTASSDIDVVINLPTSPASEKNLQDDEEEDKHDGEESGKNLVELNLLHDSIMKKFDQYILTKIETARVPILIVKKGNIEMNISFNHEVVIHNSALLKAYSDVSPRVGELVLLVKHWAKQREVNDALQGTLSSYGYVLLVIFFLQKKGLLPDLQSPSKAVDIIPTRITDNGRCSTWFSVEEDFDSKNLESKSLTELFLSFFEFYLYEFDFVNNMVAVSRRIPQRDGNDGIQMVEISTEFMKKKEFFKRDGVLMNCAALRKRTWLSIIDPFELHRCLGVSARGMDALVREMRRAVELLFTGNGSAVFAPIDRKNSERIQFPQFPMRLVCKQDPVYAYERGKALKKEFDLKNENSIKVLFQVLKTALSNVKNTEKQRDIQLNEIACLSYLSDLGFPHIDQLKLLGICDQNGTVLQIDSSHLAIAGPPNVIVKDIFKVKQSLLLVKVLHRSNKKEIATRLDNKEVQPRSSNIGGVHASFTKREEVVVTLQKKEIAVPVKKEKKGKARKKKDANRMKGKQIGTL